MQQKIAQMWGVKYETEKIENGYEVLLQIYTSAAVCFTNLRKYS